MYVDVPCPICKSAERRLIYPATKPQSAVNPDELACSTALLARYDSIQRCLKCGLLYTSPRPADSEILAGYSRMADEGFMAETGARERTYRRLLKQIAALRPGPPGRILDAGCSTGVFLKEARAAGWETEGIEPSAWAAGRARELFGLKVHECPVAQAPLEAGSFDVVTAWDVIEHMLDPMEDMRVLARALKPGGLFCASTHSIGSLAARLLRARYPFLMAMHVTHFTPRTSRLLLEKAGIEQFRVRPHLRSLRAGYLVKKLEPHVPGIAGLLDGFLGILGLRDSYIVIAGLGIFNAFGRKKQAEG